MDLARAPRRAPLTARKKGSGYENGSSRIIGRRITSVGLDLPQVSLEWPFDRVYPVYYEISFELEVQN